MSASLSIDETRARLAARGACECEDGWHVGEQSDRGTTMAEVCDLCGPRAGVCDADIAQLPEVREAVSAVTDCAECIDGLWHHEREEGRSYSRSSYCGCPPGAACCESCHEDHDEYGYELCEVEFPAGVYRGTCCSVKNLFDRLKAWPAAIAQVAGVVMLAAVLLGCGRPTDGELQEAFLRTCMSHEFSPRQCHFLYVIAARADGAADAANTSAGFALGFSAGNIR